jgi:transposase
MPAHQSAATADRRRVAVLRFQKDSALAQWFHARTADGRGGTRKTMIVALARKLLIALWRLVTAGEMPQGVVLRPAS